MPVNHINDVLALEEVSPGVFESVHKPETQANSAGNIGFGGNTIAVACMAAHQGIPDKYRIYSLNGNFLGPAYTDRKLRTRYQELRNIRTFITRLVTVSQLQDSGAERTCLVALADFQAVEPHAVLRISKAPSRPPPPRDQCTSLAQRSAELVKQGVLTPTYAVTVADTFKLGDRLFTTLWAPDSMQAATLLAVFPALPSSQDAAPVAERHSGSWTRARGEPVKGIAENASALAWKLDSGLAYLGLTHAHMWWQDVEAVATLEFSLRIFANEVDVNGWLYYEGKCAAAGVGRSFSEHQTWDDEGNLIASMTQQCVNRGRKPKL